MVKSVKSDSGSKKSNGKVSYFLKSKKNVEKSMMCRGVTPKFSFLDKTSWLLYEVCLF